MLRVTVLFHRVRQCRPIYLGRHFISTTKIIIDKETQMNSITGFILLNYYADEGLTTSLVYQSQTGFWFLSFNS